MAMKTKKNNKALWTLIAFALALLSIFAVLSQSRELSIQDLFDTIARANRFWLFLAVLCMFGFIFFEGHALWRLLRTVGYPRSHLQSVVYASADIYCSAITPSATGGQPVCAWFMKRDGVPMGYITAILAMYLIMHTFATLTIAVISLIADPGVFTELSLLSQFLIVIGYIMVLGLAILFLMLFKMERRIYVIGCRMIDKMTKKGWIKRTQHWKDRLKNTLGDYASCRELLKGQGSVLFQVYLLNIGQRMCQTVISTIMYLATGGTPSGAGTVFVTQIFSTIGSMFMPVPGGMGISDYLLYDGLRLLMQKDAALQLELISRSMSFYLTVLISMVIVLIGYLQRRIFYFTVPPENHGNKQ
jgi:uncharacterized protein (TIRG00374 family)